MRISHAMIQTERQALRYATVAEGMSKLLAEVDLTDAQQTRANYLREQLATAKAGRMTDAQLRELEGAACG